MLFNFSVFFSSLGFLVGLEAVTFFADWAFSLSVILLLFVFQSARRIGNSLLSSMTPLLFALSSVTVLYLIDSTSQRQGLIILSFAAYYLALLGIYRLRYYERDLTAKGMMAFTGMSTAFLFYSGVYGIYLNFAVPIWGLMLAYCGGTVMLSFQYLMILDRTNARRARMYSLILGLAMAETAWVINFWPFGYLTTGVIALMFYYVLWDLVQSHFQGLLSRKRVAVHLVLLCFLIGMVLSSTRWIPVV